MAKVPKVTIMQCECDNIRATGATHCKCVDANGNLLVEANVLLLKPRR